MKYTFHTKPFAHQKIAVKYALTHGSVGFLMDPGCGKTKPAVDYMACRHLFNGMTKVLVVAPKSVIGVWEEEIELHMSQDVERIVVRLEGRSKLKRLRTHHEPEILTVMVISYDSLWRMQDDLIDWEPEMVICDESHYLASPTSKRTKGVLKVGKVSKWRAILTGTFLPNGPLHAYAQLNFLNPNTFPMSWTKFKKKYAVWKRIARTYDKLIRYKRLHEITQAIEDCCLIVRKEDVLDLPEKVDKIIPVEMPAKAWKLYKDLKREKAVEIKKDQYATAELIVTELIRFQQITSGFVRVDTGKFDSKGKPKMKDVPVHNAKIAALSELIDIHLEHGEQVIIFCRFRWEFDRISELLRKKKVPFSGIDSRVNRLARDKIRRAFQSGEYKVLVNNIQAGGIGITLTAANVAIFYSMTFRLDQWLQARDRIHRPGQTRTCYYEHLIVRRTIDDKIMESNHAKKSLADRVTPKNWRKFV